MCDKTIEYDTQVEVQHGPRVTVASVQEAEEGGDIAVECRAEVSCHFLFSSFICILKYDISLYPQILLIVMSPTNYLTRLDQPPPPLSGLEPRSRSSASSAAFSP